MADTRQESIEQGFHRQRRMTVAVSLILFVYVSAIGEITKLTIFGNSITIKDPAVVGLLLWVVWGYALIRY